MRLVERLCVLAQFLEVLRLLRRREIPEIVRSLPSWKHLVQAVMIGLVEFARHFLESGDTILVFVLFPWSAAFAGQQRAAQ